MLIESHNKYSKKAIWLIEFICKIAIFTQLTYRKMPKIQWNSDVAKKADGLTAKSPGESSFLASYTTFDNDIASTVANT